MPGPSELVSQFPLKIGGATPPEEMMNDLISAEVDDSLCLPDMFLIRLRDATLRWTNSEFFDLGKMVELSVRTEQGVVKLMEGEITAIEPELSHDLGPTLLVRGYDLSHRLHRDRKTRTYLEHTDSDMAAKIAREGGLGVQMEPTRGVYRHIIQRNQTDWEFLWERARRIGYRVYVEGRTLHFRRPPGGGSVPTLEWGVDLLDFRANLSTAEQVGEVTVRGWDPVRRREILGRATRPQVDLDIGEQRQGGQATERAFQQQPRMVVVDRPVGTQAEADALAQGIYDDIGGAFIQAEGVCSGNPAVAAGATVELTGLGRRFSGRYMITHSLHRYTVQGYTTRFIVSGHRSSTLAELLRPPENGAGHSVFVAIVTNNKDPENLGRVKVKYPWLSDRDESYWARLALPGAGKLRGVIWIPDVGDEVLVAFEHGDINRPYVLGGLWSQPAPFPGNIDQMVDGQGRVTFHGSISGEFQVMIAEEPGNEWVAIIDRQNQNRVVVNRTSNKIEVVSKGDIVLEATQGNITLRGNQVEITANATVTVRGTQVKLN